MKNFREVKTNSKKEHVMQKKIIFKDFLHRYWIMKRKGK